MVSIGAEGLIVVSNEDGELVKSWEFEEGASRKKKPGPTAIVAAGDDRIAVAGQDSSIRVWDVRGCERSRMKSDQTYGLSFFFVLFFRFTGELIVGGGLRWNA